MATNTTNYSFKKPDESDFYDVQDQNGNWDMADEALKSLDTPTFEDYTGSTPVPAANTAIDGIKSKTKLSALMSNIKAAFKGACLIVHIVNNCVTNNPNLPLSAAQGKVLMDLYTRLNGDALIIAYPIDINMDTAPGLSQNMIYFYQNHFYIGYSMTVSGKLYGAQLRFGHWLTRPEYRYNQGALWTDWAAL